jgi:hypothetical protein
MLEPHGSWAKAFGKCTDGLINDIPASNTTCTPQPCPWRLTTPPSIRTSTVPPPLKTRKLNLHLSVNTPSEKESYGSKHVGISAAKQALLPQRPSPISVSEISRPKNNFSSYYHGLYSFCMLHRKLIIPAFSSPPATVRIRNFFDNAYVFLGLYVTTFFSVSALSYLPRN